MINREIRQEIRKSGIYQWQIAAYIGVTEMTLIRWLRFELSNEKKEQIRSAIAELQKEGV